MTEPRSKLWFTTLSGLRGGRPEWAEIAHYLEPVQRYIARRAPLLGGADRDDLAQDVLVAMAERLVRGYDASRGPFRAFLAGAIDHKLADHARGRARRAAEAIDEDALAAPMDETAAAAVDLEAELLRAVRAFHDAHAQGDGDLDLVWCLGDRLVKGLAEDEIAAANGWSRDRVKRLLARARGEVVRELVRSLLARDHPKDEDAGATVDEAAELVREGLRRPREASRLLERARLPDAARVAGELLDAVRAARRYFSRIDTVAEQELLRGLEEVFADR